MRKPKVQPGAFVYVVLDGPAIERGDVRSLWWKDGRWIYGVQRHDGVGLVVCSFEEDKVFEEFTDALAALKIAEVLPDDGDPSGSFAQ